MSITSQTCMLLNFLWHWLFKRVSCKPECLAFCVNEGKPTECYKSLDINQVICLGQSFFFLEKSRVGNSLFRSLLFHSFALRSFTLSLFRSLLFRSSALCSFAQNCSYERAIVSDLLSSLSENEQFA